MECKSTREEELEEKLKQKYQDFEEIFENVQSMSDQIGLQFLFLKDIAKDLKLIKNKLDKLQLIEFANLKILRILQTIADAVELIGNDIKKMKRKSYQELFQIRKNKVLEMKNKRELDAVYVELKTQETNFRNGQNIQIESDTTISCLFNLVQNNDNGKINKFLWSEKEKTKDILLIRGQAGSGKTRAPKMVEEFFGSKMKVVSKIKLNGFQF